MFNERCQFCFLQLTLKTVFWYENHSVYFFHKFYEAVCLDVSDIKSEAMPETFLVCSPHS